MASTNGFEFPIYNAVVALLTLAVTLFIARKTALGVVVFLGVHHKMAIWAIVLYFVLLWGVQYFLLAYLPQPRQWVAASIATVEEVAKNVQESGPQVVQNIGDGFNHGIASVMEQITEAIPDPTVAVLPPVVTPTPEVEAYCVSRPGRPYTQIFLRLRPNWDEAGDLNFVADRDSRLKVYSKLLCVDSEGDTQMWFEVRATDGSRRFVAEAVCPTTSDVQLLPDTDSQSADGTNSCSAYR